MTWSHRIAVPSKKRKASLALASTSKEESQQSDAVPRWRTAKFDEFPPKLRVALETEQRSLIAAREELENIARAFRREKSFIEFFTDDADKIVKLDVSGRPMSVKRSTLGLCKDSALAKQFNDELWSRKKIGDELLSVKQWEVEHVVTWAKDLDGVLDETVDSLRKNKVNGAELVSMGREDFREIGITKIGALAMLIKAVKDLRSGSHSGVTSIEQSHYCFGKIVDQLRLRAMQHSNEELAPALFVRESEKKRFKRTVDFYFPGELSAFILDSGLTGFDSSIVSDQESKRHIREWLEEENVRGDVDLLYRASRDGWSASQFHSMCDNKGATITIIQSEGGYVFGGFADKPWGTSQEDWCSSPKAFLFALRSHIGLGPTKMRQVHDHQYAVYHDSSYGPTFGAGYDIRVSSNSNTNSSSEIFIGNTYQCPPGQNARTFLTGNRNFRATEIEVFRIH